MADYKHTIYPGADYGLDPNYGEPVVDTKYKIQPHQFGLTTDPRTSNQLDAVSKKLSTGAKVVEVTGIQPEILESIPKQQFEEINRLRKLTGVDFTFHGPLIEPTGIGQDGWSESKREQAERQMWSALERSHDLNPEKNVIVTFHSSNGLPEARTRVKNKDGKEVSTELFVIDERSGRFGRIPAATKDYFSEGKEETPDQRLARLNKENWNTELNNVNIEVNRAKEAIEVGLASRENLTNQNEVEKNLPHLYEVSKKNPSQYKQMIENLGDIGRIIEKRIDNLNYGEIFAKKAYDDFKEMYNQAYSVAENTRNNEEKAKLESYRKEVAKKVEEYKKDPLKIGDFVKEVSNGIKLLDSITPPNIYKPLEDFAIEKTAKTFGNIAFNSYNKFRETAPIVSIENPPVGMGLTRADEIKKIVEDARKNFTQRARDELGLSEKEAKKQAEKLIGVTWDVGHINMMKKYGYENEDVIDETKKIAKMVKHVHLSDNFGLNHTELPMGMGNVPTDKMLDLIHQYNKKVKHIVETGGPWYQFFRSSPLPETLRAFGSPIYAMKAGETWNETPGTPGAYFAGYGATLPDQHFSMYGAGFSQLPQELGGQIGGRSRLSGAPIE